MKKTSQIYLIFALLLFLNIVSADQIIRQGKITGGVVHTMLPWFKESFLDILDDIDEAKESNKQIILFFHLNECPYCDKMLKNLDSEPLKGFVQKYFDVIAINIKGDKNIAINESESITEKKLAENLKVQYTPTMIFLNHKNKVVARTNGYRTTQKMKLVLDYVSEKAYTKYSLSEFLQNKNSKEAYQLQHNPLFKNNVDLSIVKTPLAIIFEDVNCNACPYFHQTTLKNKEVINELNEFTVVRLNAKSKQIIIDNTGNKKTIKNWVKELKLNYRPGIILFDKGREITRIDGFLYTFHFKEVLRYVSGQFYQKFSSYNSYLSFRQKQLLKQGINIDISQ